MSIQPDPGPRDSEESRRYLQKMLDDYLNDPFLMDGRLITMIKERLAELPPPPADDAAQSPPP